jgi:DNA-binding CsgD family transcriptional regulator
MFIEASTVEAHLLAARKKMGAKNAAHAAALWAVFAVRTA